MAEHRLPSALDVLLASLRPTLEEMDRGRVAEIARIAQLPTSFADLMGDVLRRQEGWAGARGLFREPVPASPPSPPAPVQRRLRGRPTGTRQIRSREALLERMDKAIVELKRYNILITQELLADRMGIGARTLGRYCRPPPGFDVDWRGEVLKRGGTLERPGGR